MTAAPQQFNPGAFAPPQVSPPQVGPPVGQAPPPFVTGQPVALQAAGTVGTVGTVGTEPVQLGPDGQPVKPKQKRNRTPRAKYRADGAPQLTAVPADYNPRKHLPLGKADFADEPGKPGSGEALFYDWKAVQARKMAERHAQTAADIRAGGGGETLKAKKKLEKYMTGMAELRSKLEGSIGKDAFERMVKQMAEQMSQGGAAPVI